MMETSASPMTVTAASTLLDAAVGVCEICTSTDAMKQCVRAGFESILQYRPPLWKQSEEAAQWLEDFHKTAVQEAKL